MESFATTWVLPLLIGVSSAVAATYFAFKKFRAEKLWELRANAYAELVDGLHEMKRVREAELEMLRLGDDLESGTRTELWEASRQAKRKILKIFDNASFFLSEEIVELSQEFSAALERAFHETDTFLDMLLLEERAISECLAKVKLIGRKELGI